MKYQSSYFASRYRFIRQQKSSTVCINHGAAVINISSFCTENYLKGKIILCTTLIVLITKKLDRKRMKSDICKESENLNYRPPLSENHCCGIECNI